MVERYTGEVHRVLGHDGRVRNRSREGTEQSSEFVRFETIRSAGRPRPDCVPFWSQLIADQVVREN